MPGLRILRLQKRTLSAALFLVFSAVLAGQGALAQRRQRFLGHDLPSNCQLQPGGESTVLSIEGPQTLRLADGRFLRLSEILVPNAGPAGFDPSSAATAYLRETALGRKAEVKFGGTQRDRYGVYLGHIYVAGEPPVWLQEGLVKSGLAQVMPQADNHACSQQLFPFETEARNEKRGHWGLAYFKVLRARDSRSILNLVQTYQIVEGEVDHASERGGRIIVHFGPESRFGFTAIIEPGAKKRFTGKQSPESWTGLVLRVRGWVDRRRGPSIPVTQPEQIEFLSRDLGTQQAQEAR